MNTKLTLRMEEAIIRKAKSEALRRGTSVSRMVEEFIEVAGDAGPTKRRLPPLTASLLGILKGRGLSMEDYRKHLREKYR